MLQAEFLLANLCKERLKKKKSYLTCVHVSAMAPLLNYSRTDTQAGTDKRNKGQQYMINTETN